MRMWVVTSEDFEAAGAGLAGYGQGGAGELRWQGGDGQFRWQRCAFCGCICMRVGLVCVCVSDPSC